MSATAKKDVPTKVLDKAYTLLWEEGYTNMSINDLIAKAKISKGGLFHYFPNKKTIVLQVINTYFNERILGTLDQHLSQAKDARTLKIALMDWLGDYYNSYISADFKTGCMLGNLALETAHQDEELRETIKGFFLQWENKLVTYLRPLASADRLLMEPRQFARLLIAMLEGITMTSKVHRDHNRAGRDFQALAELIERMIRD